MAPEAGEAWGDTRRATVAFQNDATETSVYRKVNWSPVLISSLEAVQSAFDVDVRFVSKWDEQVLTEVVPILNGLFTASYLPLEVRDTNARGVVGARKARRIVEDQEGSPSPFVWLDDVGVRDGAWVLEKSQSRPAYICALDPAYGITPDVIAKLWAWFADNAPAHDWSPRRRGLEGLSGNPIQDCLDE